MIIILILLSFFVCAEPYYGIETATVKDLKENKANLRNFFFDKSKLIHANDKLFKNAVTGTYTFRDEINKKNEQLSLIYCGKKICLDIKKKYQCVFDTPPFFSDSHNAFYIESRECFIRGKIVPGTLKMSRLVFYSKESQEYFVTGILLNKQ
jgi:hypothetical protein